MEFLAWWNLVFELPFLAGVLYLLVFAAGLAADGHEPGLHVDTDIGHDLGVEHSVGVGTGHDPSALFKVISFLGLGKVPLSLIVMSVCFIWGFAGWASNQVFRDLLQSPLLFIWLSLGVAFGSAFFLTGLLARGLAKLMPATESYATTKRDLIGKRAEARFTITEQVGRAQLHDAFGHLLEVSCRVRSGEAPIPAGSCIVLMEYDANNQTFLVRLDPLAASGLSTPSLTSERKEILR